MTPIQVTLSALVEEQVGFLTGILPQVQDGRDNKSMPEPVVYAYRNYLVAIGQLQRAVQSWGQPDDSKATEVSPSTATTSTEGEAGNEGHQQSADPTDDTPPEGRPALVKPTIISPAVQQAMLMFFLPQLGALSTAAQNILTHHSSDFDQDDRLLVLLLRQISEDAVWVIRDAKESMSAPPRKSFQLLHHLRDTAQLLCAFMAGAQGRHFDWFSDLQMLSHLIPPTAQRLEASEGLSGDNQ